MMDTGVGVYVRGVGACVIAVFVLARYVDQDPPGCPGILILRTLDVIINPGA
jgi:hypothetical protein